eukprot:m.267940 g.267940  ORF g.267940 m.267940 type:complete len:64 (+) comp34253_c0_seq1:12-203(+)
MSLRSFLGLLVLYTCAVCAVLLYSTIVRSWDAFMLALEMVAVPVAALLFWLLFWIGRELFLNN